MRSLLRTWGPALVWTFLLFAVSSRSSLPVSLDGGSDKLAHFGAYLVLGFLFARAFDRSVARIWPALAAGLMTGALDEVYQGVIPGRSSELGDWAADALGVAAGLFFYHLMVRVAGSRRRRTAQRTQLQDG